MTPDDQLSAFLGETPKQSRADVFTLEVMKRVERQAFVERLAVAAGGAAVLGLVLWACAPVLNLAVTQIAPSLLPIATLLSFVAAILALGGPAVWRQTGLPRG
ncbi:hypothetical protein [Caulobacter sp.]|uniref:hypothetical protein n=1 Tax=Caulobacter sp. TaxID=78 RepID=UPI002B4928B5|nr:hypothetical protein [Caulobacter sp.]HJV40450.1 hypothetical protein [Caulobacter sp.]